MMVPDLRRTLQSLRVTQLAVSKMIMVNADIPSVPRQAKQDYI